MCALKSTSRDWLASIALAPWVCERGRRLAVFVGLLLWSIDFSRRDRHWKRRIITVRSLILTTVAPMPTPTPVLTSVLRPDFHRCLLWLSLSAKVACTRCCWKHSVTALFNLNHVSARKIGALRQVLVECIVEAIEISFKSGRNARNSNR